MRKPGMSVLEQLTDHALSRCRHFTGVGNDTCKAGVRYEDVRLDHEPTDGRSRSWPCLRDAPLAAGRCASVSFRSEEEAKAEAEEGERRLTLSGEAMRRAREASRGIKGGSGVVECPKCGGRLHWSKAAVNGHIWGRCETKGCLSWIQ